VTTKERLDRHDRQIAAIRKLIEQGTRLVVGTRQDIRLLAKDIRTLAASQKKTDASLQALISALRRSGGNGHSKVKVDLQ
jgi:predicted nicotinamide N-methyase